MKDEKNWDFGMGGEEVKEKGIGWWLIDVIATHKIYVK